MAVAASGAMAMALPVSAALAADGASADGTAAGSPGVISGNTVQLPVHVPVNVCGNTVDVVGLLNPAMGNKCANGGGAGTGTGASSTSGGATATSSTNDSPGVVSGNGIQLPVHLPVNLSGNSVDVVGVGNPVFGNSSVNGSAETPPAPEPETPAPPRSVPVKAHPAPLPPQPAAPEPMGALAHTGADLTAPALAGGAALIATGVVLFRRFRPGSDS
ncbi:chaplin [Streptomyces sp. NPDC005573]|uniref:chaplin n=1 Tax=Streptomyces sp. NPDC005573 TaxID=3156890 RepID=UPI00339DF3CB